MQQNEVAKTIYNRCHDDRILFRKKNHSNVTLRNLQGQMKIFYKITRT